MKNFKEIADRAKSDPERATRIEEIRQQLMKMVRK